jgi:hypothetical protein
VRQPTPGELSNVLVTLGIDASSSNSKGWATTSCPACGREGASASFRVNINNGAFRCWRCSASSNDVALHDFVNNPLSPSLSTAVGMSNDRPPLDEELVMRYHRFLAESPSVIQDLERVRGWTEATMKRIGIGWDGSHFWLPIRRITKELINARMYDPFRKSKVKSYHYQNEAGTQRTAAWVPFGEESLEGHEYIWWFEGEPDGILAAQMGLPAALITGGAGTWTDEALSIQKKRKAVICYDIDAKGKRGARSVAARFRSAGVDVVVLDFPLSKPEYNDFSDAVLKDNRDVKYFRSLLKSLKEGSAPPPPDPPVFVTLGGGVPGMDIVVKAHVLGSHTTPLLVPSSLQATCSMNWQPDRACRGCSLNNADGNMRVDIDPESTDLGLLVATTVRGQDAEYKRIAELPARCPMVRFEIGDFWQVQLLKLVPPMSERTGGDSTVRSAMHVSPADGRPPEIRANQLYLFQGVIGPDVKTNEWTLTSAEAHPAEDDVDSFVCTEEIVAALEEVFTPNVWTVAAVSAMFEREEIAISRHVTKIYGRDLLFRLVDLTYHSIIRWKFREDCPTRGWMSVGMVGDSRTGKSETLQKVAMYFGLGKMVLDPANTTFAGLVGGLQQVGKGDKSWVVTWGLIPTNDRGIVIVDELSSLSTNDISKMSGMRSSGIAELTKIRSASTPARTRLVIGGNPRGEGRLDSYSTVVEAFSELIGQREDVARCDVVMGIKEGLNKETAKAHVLSKPDAQPIDVGLRRALIRYAWSRNQEQVHWDKEAETECVRQAEMMIADYDSTIPIVEPSEQDIRIARVAVAAAVRTFSHVDGDPDVVLVRKCHVLFAAKTMREAMDGDLGYDHYSAFKRRNTLEREQLLKKLSNVQLNVGLTCRTLLKIRRVTPNSIGMSLAFDGADAREFISAMVQLGAAEFPAEDHGRNTSVVWTPLFIKMLRELESNPPVDATESLF